MTVKNKVKTAKGFNFNKAFQTNQTHEELGSWTEISMDGETLEVLIARKDNKKARALLRSMLKANKRKLTADDNEAEELFLDIRRKIMAKSILLGWKNLIVDGKEAEYSEDLAYTLLGFSDFFKAIEEASEDFTSFMANEEEKILKN